MISQTRIAFIMAFIFCGKSLAEYDDRYYQPSHNSHYRPSHRLPAPPPQPQAYVSTSVSSSVSFSGSGGGNHAVSCPSTMRSCKDGTCIPHKWFCDNEEDCANGEDEAYPLCKKHHAPEYTPYTPYNPVKEAEEHHPPPVAAKVCSLDRFYCDGFCIPNSYKCNGVKDCADSNDEYGCLIPKLQHHPHIRGCSVDEETCFDGKCISSHQLCNGFKDCSTGEDEFGCTAQIPKSKAFRCMESCFGVSRPQCITQAPTTPKPTTTTTRTTTTTPRPTRLVCPENMDLVLDRCIYISVIPPRKWHDAKHFCTEHDLTLVEIDSGNFFVSLLKHLNSTAMSSYSFWVGASDLHHEGDWRWVSSNKPVYLGTPLWTVASNGVEYVQQPGGGREENCGLLESCPFTYLNDYDCDETRSYICQHEGRHEYI